MQNVQVLVILALCYLFFGSVVFHNSVVYAESVDGKIVDGNEQEESILTHLKSRLSESQKDQEGTSAPTTSSFEGTLPGNSPILADCTKTDCTLDSFNQTNKTDQGQVFAGTPILNPPSNNNGSEALISLRSSLLAKLGVQSSCPAGTGLCAAGWCCPLGHSCCNSNPISSGCTENGVCSISTTESYCPPGQVRCRAGWCCPVSSVTANVCCDGNPINYGCTQSGVCSISNPNDGPTPYGVTSCPPGFGRCQAGWCCPLGSSCCNGNVQKEGCTKDGSSSCLFGVPGWGIGGSMQCPYTVRCGLTHTPSDNMCFSGSRCFLSECHCPNGEDPLPCQQGGYTCPASQVDDFSVSYSGGSGSGACFPADSIAVTEERGPVQIDQLEIGERVQVIDPFTGKVSFTPLIGFIHKDKQSMESYIKVLLKERPSPLFVSSEHNVFVVQSSLGGVDRVVQAMLAKHLRPGMKMFIATTSETATEVEVDKLEFGHIKRGRMAPLTESGTVVVDGVAASCYAEADHAVAHLVFAPFRIISNFGLSIANEVNEEGILWYAKVAQALARFVPRSIWEASGTAAITTQL